MHLLAIFGPTAAGKTAVAIAVAERLRKRGEDPVAISCDAIQVYRGLEILSGAATPAEQERLEHRLLGFVDIREEFSAGRYAVLARAEIDGLLAAGRRPILVGGTGLYLRLTLSEIELRPSVPRSVREALEREWETRGPQALHAEIEPRAALGIHPGDRVRVIRALELQRSGFLPPRSHAEGGELWRAKMRVPTMMVGLALPRKELDARIEARVDAMVAAGAAQEACAAVEAGASRTARATLGFKQLLAGDVDGMKVGHRRYARRQLTWMRRMDGVTEIDRHRHSDEEVADWLVTLLDEAEATAPPPSP